MDDLARDEYVYCAKLCKFVENYDEMMIIMVNLVNKLTPSDDLNRVERNLLLVPFYKKLIVLRNAWRGLSIVEMRNNRTSIINEFRSKVKDATRKLCGGVLNALGEKLLRIDLAESQAYYLKTKGDVMWSLIEFEKSPKSNQLMNKAKEAFEQLERIARDSLGVCDATRLQLMLHFSYFYKEVICSSEYSYALVNEALEGGQAQLDQLNEDVPREVQDFITKLRELRDLLTDEVVTQWLPEVEVYDILENDDLNFF